MLSGQKATRAKRVRPFGWSAEARISPAPLSPGRSPSAADTPASSFAPQRRGSGGLGGGVSAAVRGAGAALGVPCVDGGGWGFAGGLESRSAVTSARASAMVAPDSPSLEIVLVLTTAPALSSRRASASHAAGCPACAGNRSTQAQILAWECSATAAAGAPKCSLTLAANSTGVGQDSPAQLHSSQGTPATLSSARATDTNDRSGTIADVARTPI